MCLSPLLRTFYSVVAARGVVELPASRCELHSTRPASRRVARYGKESAICTAGSVSFRLLCGASSRGWSAGLRKCPNVEVVCTHHATVWTNRSRFETAVEVKLSCRIQRPPSTRKLLSAPSALLPASAATRPRPCTAVLVVSYALPAPAAHILLALLGLAVAAAAIAGWLGVVLRLSDDAGGWQQPNETAAGKLPLAAAGRGSV